MIENQNIIAKFLIKSDRDTNVRREKEYLNLFKPNFKYIKAKIINFLFLIHGLQLFAKNSYSVNL